MYRSHNACVSPAREHSEAVAESGELRGVHPRPLHHLGRHLERAAAERSSGVGELDLEDTLVRCASRLGDEALCLQPLDEGRKGRGLEGQFVGEFAERAGRLLPQREHDEVLRVGESERLENRTIDRDHVARCGDQREAHLIVELEKVVRGFHAVSLASLIISTLMI